jgi:hypothetical protein
MSAMNWRSPSSINLPVRNSQELLIEYGLGIPPSQSVLAGEEGGLAPYAVICSQLHRRGPRRDGLNFRKPAITGSFGADSGSARSRQTD